MIRISSFALGMLSIFSTSLLAQNQELKINLKAFDITHSQEIQKSDITLSITEYSQNKEPQQFRVPHFPSHLLSQYLKDFKEITLWKKNINKCKPMDLLISLYEEHSLGTVKLSIDCVNGQVKEQWHISNPEKVAHLPNQINGFHFKGTKAEYNITFSLDNIINHHKDHG